MFYKYNSVDGDEESVSSQVSFNRIIANSKATTACFNEEINIVCNTKHRHHLSIVVRVNEDQHGRIFEMELHAHKYLKNNDDGSQIFRESVKYKVDKKDQSADLSSRWYTGAVTFKIQVGGNINPTASAEEANTPPPPPPSSTQVTPICTDANGNVVVVDPPTGAAPFMVQLTLKNMMKAAASSCNDPETLANEKRKAAGQRRQVCLALLLIFLFLGSGALFFPLVEGWTVLDSIYFGMVTITTVGYGDMGPVTVNGRIFTSFYVMSGVGIIGVAVGIVGGYVSRMREDGGGFVAVFSSSLVCSL